MLSSCYFYTDVTAVTKRLWVLWPEKCVMRRQQCTKSRGKNIQNTAGLPTCPFCEEHSSSLWFLVFHENNQLRHSILDERFLAYPVQIHRHQCKESYFITIFIICWQIASQSTINFKARERKRERLRKRERERKRERGKSTDRYFLWLTTNKN